MRASTIADARVRSLFRYFLAVPTIAVRIQQGSIIIAARDLPYQTAITFRQAQGLLCVSKPYPKDVYKMTLKMTMLMAEMTMLPNTKQMRTQKDKTGAAAGVGPNVYGGGDKGACNRPTDVRHFVVVLTQLRACSRTCRGSGGQGQRASRHVGLD